jgi:hypothetical protein
MTMVKAWIGPWPRAALDPDERSRTALASSLCRGGADNAIAALDAARPTRPSVARGRSDFTAVMQN